MIKPELASSARARSAVIALRSIALALAAVLGLVQCGAAPTSRAPAADDAAAPSNFGAATIARGARLAALGNCGYCHTAPGGAAYAGGLGIQSPFGTIYSTNITPHREAGIGGWSLADFTRAMREGENPGGRHLYPAFPYDHFTLLTDEDIVALYAFVMTRDAVDYRPPENKLMFPVNLRLSAAAWKLLFFKRRSFQHDAAKSAEWNRGAYLVEGLAHCGACHTPRNLMGAEKAGEAFSGGEADGWIAPALDGSSPAAFPWTVERLAAYLRTGSEENNGTAAGPMKPVVHNLAGATEQDLRAIAVYVASLDPRAVDERERRGEALAALHKQVPEDAPGALAYRGACAPCHGVRRVEAGALRLTNSSALALDTPVNLLRIVRDGIRPGEGESGPWMPSFAGSFTDKQLGELVAYLRERFSDRPPWKDISGELERIRRNVPGDRR